MNSASIMQVEGLDTASNETSESHSGEAWDRTKGLENSPFRGAGTWSMACNANRRRRHPCLGT